MDKDSSRKAFWDDYYQFSGIKKPIAMDLNLSENKHGIANKVEDLKQTTEGVTTDFTISGYTFTFVDGLLKNITNVSTSPSRSPSKSPSKSPSVSPS